jgi:transglutaminase-like putative cysteine protease
MYEFVNALVRRLEPRAGWPVALLVGFAAATCSALAASGATLPLPDGLIFWAGLGGAALGLRAAGPRRRAWRPLYAAAALALGAILLLAACQSLPPAGLLWRDAGELWAAAGRWLAGAAGEGPRLLTPGFLRLALPRAWASLAAAPNGGEAGAALIVTALGMTTTLIGAAALGFGCGSGRRPLSWGLPLTAALALTTILGGGGGAGLVLGTGALLALAGLVGHQARERAWEAAGVGYSEELRWGVLGWGAALATGVLVAALALPTALPQLAPPIDAPAAPLPSGLAAIERRVVRGGGQPQADPGLSALPAVTLGVSLNPAPPESTVMRVRLDAPLPAGPYPRYWRARLLNVYNGRAWYADARVGPPEAPGPELQAAAGAVVQEIELLDDGGPALAALPDVLALDVPARRERLPDGSLAALSGAPEGLRRYRALSRPQELAPLPVSGTGGVPEAALDGRDSLGLPRELPPRVGELARSITAGAGGRYAQALAIEAYLRGLPYAYEVQPIPAAGDAVDQFLFTMRQGYCTYYAASMAVLARSLGIPARVAVGYATGAYDEALGGYVVRAADAHAWPELLIDGRWLPFEPTPVRPLPARSGPAPAPAPVPAPAPAPQPAPWAAPWPWALAAAGLALAALVAAWWLRRAGPRPAPLDRALLRLERVGARAGVPWPAGATLHEYGRMLEARGVGGPVGELVALAEDARYGGHPLTAAQRRRLQELARGLRAAPGPRRG